MCKNHWVTSDGHSLWYSLYDMSICILAYYSIRCSVSFTLCNQQLVGFYTHKNLYFSYFNNCSTYIWCFCTQLGYNHWPITNPNDFYINFVLCNLCKSYRILHNKHNLHCTVPCFKVFVMVVWWWSIRLNIWYSYVHASQI